MTYAACILWTFVMALWAAADDAEQIRNNERLNKPLQWLARAFGVTAFCVACGLWWMALPMGALFSSVFRFDLNRRRGLDWRYVNSASSYYDAIFVGLYWAAVIFWLIVTRKSVTLTTTDETVHSAGLLAYIVELAFAVLIFVLFM